MVQIPAICHTCGAVYPSGIDVVGGGGTFAGNRSQCPRCGAMGSIPDGVYDVVGDSIRVLAASEISRRELERIAKVFGELRDREATPEEVRQAIQDEAPSLSPIVEKFGPKTFGDWIALLALIVAIATLLLEQRNALTAADIERLSGAVIERTIEETRQSPAPSPTAGAPAKPTATRKVPPPPPRKVRERRKREQRKHR